MDKSKEPIILDFGGDAVEAFDKLEAILCNTHWSSNLMVYKDVPSETKLLFALLRKRAIVVGEVCYMPIAEFPDELRQKSREYMMRLSKRDEDYVFMNAVHFFSQYEPDISMTDRMALYYPEIKAYVRCGDLMPEKLMELLSVEGCERVIVFGGAQPNADCSEEAFYSFEMSAPKAYIMERLEKLQEEKLEAMCRAIENTWQEE